MKVIAEAFKLAIRPVYDLEPTVRGLVALGDVIPGVDRARLAELEYVAITSHERGPVIHANIALPTAAWAEVAGTITNAKGMVQRMHAAFAPPGQALPGWEAIVRLAQATNVTLPWTHAREVFKDMIAMVPAWSGLTWVREARPLALRFAGSRG